MSRKNQPIPDSNDADAAEAPSKSQLKRDAKAVQSLASRLLSSRASEIRRLDLPEHILAAIAEGRLITRFGAKKRHTQYLAKLLRTETDIDNIQSLLEQRPVGASNHEQSTPTPSAHEQTLELLISTPDDGFKKLREAYPALELQRVSRLLRKISAADSDPAGHAAARQALLKLLVSHR